MASFVTGAKYFADGDGDDDDSQASFDDPPPPLSRRAQDTDVPCIVQMQGFLAEREGDAGAAAPREKLFDGPALSLAQGAVYWNPPAACVAEAAARLTDGDGGANREAHAYGGVHGTDELRALLRAKLREENGLDGVDVMVTAGANQACMNAVLTLLDPGDRAVLFRPHYFNHAMALQLANVRTVSGDMTPACQPDLRWLRAHFAAERAERQAVWPPRTRLVVIVNPGNPTGTVVPRATLEEARALCAANGCWLLVDNAYEHFIHDDDAPSCKDGGGESGGESGGGGGGGGARAWGESRPGEMYAQVEGPGNPSWERRNPDKNPNQKDKAAKAVSTNPFGGESTNPFDSPPEHACIGGDHVLNVFTMSKSYGMMGWRIGYVAYAARAGVREQMVKAQDTIAVCPTLLSQYLAEACLRPGGHGGPSWVAGRVATLKAPRAACRAALALDAGNADAGRYAGVLDRLDAKDAAAAAEAAEEDVHNEEGHASPDGGGGLQGAAALAADGRFGEAIAAHNKLLAAEEISYFEEW